MKMLVFDMEILDESDGYFRHRISHNDQHTEILFHPVKRHIVFPESDPVSFKLIDNQEQILKILCAKRTDTFYHGFRLKFILMDNKEVALFNDLTKVIVLDRRNGEKEIKILDCGSKGIHEIFTDGCFTGT